MTVVRYADVRGSSVAYATEGSGPVVVQVSNWLDDVESELDVPFQGEFVRRITEYAQFVWFDHLGTGHSDPITGDWPSIEEYAETIGSVMDAVGAERATLVAWDASTATAVAFAARHPERVTGIIVVGGTARWLADVGYAGMSEESMCAGVDALSRMWGTVEYARALAPSMASDLDACETVARWHRQTASPGTARRVFELLSHIDVRSLLPLVTCPVLVLAESSALMGAPLDQCQYLADHLSDGRLKVLDTADHLPYQRAHRDWLHENFEEFITGRPAIRRVDDRVLTTILFTDLVSSTTTAAELGDDRWRRMLDDIEHLVVTEVERFKGRVIKSTGDGILATFDGPARSIRCALAVRAAVRSNFQMEVRAGVHTGEVEVRDGDIGGIAVHVAARIMAMAEPGEVLASSTVSDLATGSGLSFHARGDHELRGVRGAFTLFAAEG